MNNNIKLRFLYMLYYYQIISVASVFALFKLGNVVRNVLTILYQRKYPQM